MKKREAKNAIVLARVSTMQQSLESQTAKVLAAASGDGYADPIIIENKESAVKNDAEHLAGIQEMQQHIERGDIAVVYISELSRLSRRPKDLFEIRDYLMEHRVQLICLNPYFRLLSDDGGLDPTANIVLSLYSAINEQECMLRSERCRRGKLKKKAEGKFVGGKLAMGLSRDKDDNFVIGSDAEVVRRIFREYAAGKSKLAIARDLRSEGYLQNFQTAQYAHTHIDNVLRNADYTGLNGRPQIISESLFAQVQERLSKPQAQRQKVDRLALAAGRMTNPESECPKQKYYVNTRQGSYYCLMDVEEAKKKFINIRGLDALLWWLLKREYSSIQSTKSENKIQKKRYAALGRQLDKMRLDVLACSDKIERVEERYCMGKISKERADAMERKILAERDAMFEQIKELQKQQDDIYKEVWKADKRDVDEMSDGEKMELSRRLIHNIELTTPKKMQWRCRIRWVSGKEEVISIDSYHWKYYDEAGNELAVDHCRGKDMDEAEKAYIESRKKYKR